SRFRGNDAERVGPEQLRFFDKGLPMEWRRLNGPEGAGLRSTFDFVEKPLIYLGFSSQEFNSEEFINSTTHANSTFVTPAKAGVQANSGFRLPPE
ncbi:MAG: hypothetical protein AAB091_08115, partial [Elusimicrobiota bacterium]